MGVAVLRVEQDLFHSTILHDPATMHDQDANGNVGGKDSADFLETV
jgi:hypothetical protein